MNENSLDKHSMAINSLPVWMNWQARDTETKQVKFGTRIDTINLLAVWMKMFTLAIIFSE